MKQSKMLIFATLLSLAGSGAYADTAQHEASEHAAAEKSILEPLTAFFHKVLKEDLLIKFADVRAESGDGLMVNPNRAMERHSRQFRDAPLVAAARWRAHFQAMLPEGELLLSADFDQIDPKQIYWIQSEKPSPFWNEPIQLVVRTPVRFILTTSRGVREAEELCDVVKEAHDESGRSEKIEGILLHRSYLSEVR